MPVLGSASTAGTATNIARGLIVPTGSLDTFKTKLKGHASGLCEIVLFGDSTDDGANDFEGTIYPWSMRLLDRLRSAGVTYGGRGLFSYRMSINSSSIYTKDPDGYPIVSARDASGWTDSASAVNGFSCSTDGKTITFQGTGTAVRVNLQRGFNSAKKIGVTIDGGAETVYDGGLVAPSPTYYDVLPQATTGLTEGTHTVVFRDAGGADIKTPAVAQTAIAVSAGAGGPAAGTYWYGITAVSASGESTMSTPLSATLSGSQTAQIKFYCQTGWTNINLYRSTTQGGTYGLVATVTAPAVPTSMTATLNAINDNASATPGAAPPVTSTLGKLTSGQTAAAGIEFFRGAGVIVHNEAIYGKAFADFIAHDGTTAAGWRGASAARFGLQSETSNYTAGMNRGFLNGQPQGAFPQYRKPALVIFKLGTNDLNPGSPDTTGQPITNWNNYFENLAYGIRTARAAGADVLLISPVFTAAGDPGSNHYGGRFKSAVMTTALAHGCAYADFQEAVGWDMANTITKGYQGGSQSVGNPHLKVAGYQAEADWLYTALFAPLLAS